MLLVMDVGNTNVAVGVWDGQRLAGHWRLLTAPERTDDEYAMLLLGLFRLAGIDPRRVQGVAIASVVPPLTPVLERACQRYFGLQPLVVGPGVRTGMPILYDNPREVGADRIVNAVAAYEKYRCGLIVVDFGTATTFDCISPRGEYLGGAIAPGVLISSEALFQRTSKLPRVEVARPRSVVGKDTVSSIQSGLFYGYVGMVDGLVERIRQELGLPMRAIATGGLAPLFVPHCRTLEAFEELLTLEGLRIIYERNRR